MPTVCCPKSIYFYNGGVLHIHIAEGKAEGIRGLGVRSYR